MNYFYALALGLAGSLLFSAPMTKTMGNPLHTSHADHSAYASNLTSNNLSDKDPISTKNGSVSANLTKWNLSEAEAAQHFNRWLGLDGNYSFEKIAEKTDAMGITHISYQQFYKNLPVDNSLLLLHSKNGKAHYLNGKIAEVSQINTQFSLTAEMALTKAKQAYGITELFEENEVVKTIVEITNEKGSEFVAAYKIKLAASQPLVLRNVYVDAQSGNIIQSINLIQDYHVEGTGLTLYQGEQDINIDLNDGVYRLKDVERNIQTYDAQNVIVTWTGFSGEEDIQAAGPYFEGITLNNFELVAVDGVESGSIFFRIQDSFGTKVYSSNPFSPGTLPRTFSNLNLSLYNFVGDYSVLIFKKVYGEEDELLTSFDLNLNEGDHLYDEDGAEASYSVNTIGNAAVDVHWGMGQVLDFYNQNFDWNSYDNQGSIVRQYLNPPNDFMGGDIGMPNNAFALQDPFNIMVYGMGDGFNMSPLVALDIAGHEFTHLIVSKNGNGGLNYQGEPGALNESFADIFGTCIEFFATDNPNWELGEDVVLVGSNLRSLENPKNPTGLSYQPDTYQGQYWANTNSNYDSGGVHTNSGVQNYWFYLLTEGGSGTNDNNHDYEVEGIGMEKSKFIAYNNLMNYLSPNASYYDAYYGSMQAANDLHGLPSFEYTQTAKAWYAVGNADNPDEYCSGTAILTEMEGYIEDGSGEGEYVNNSHCSWLIQPEEAEFISLAFQRLDTEENTDFVVIYDGADSSAPILGEFSGNEIPEDLLSTGGAVFIEFYSDQEGKGEGWEIKYATNKLGVSKNEMQKQLSVFPNPSNGNFNVTSQLPEEVSMEVYNINGRRITQPIVIQQGDNALNMSHLNAGIYFLKFSNGENTFTEKLIIN